MWAQQVTTVSKAEKEICTLVYSSANVLFNCEPSLLTYLPSSDGVLNKND